jgi:hypothetical protein
MQLRDRCPDELVVAAFESFYAYHLRFRLRLLVERPGCRSRASDPPGLHRNCLPD